MRVRHLNILRTCRKRGRRGRRCGCGCPRPLTTVNINNDRRGAASDESLAADPSDTGHRLVFTNETSCDDAVTCVNNLSSNIPDAAGADVATAVNLTQTSLMASPYFRSPPSLESSFLSAACLSPVSAVPSPSAHLCSSGVFCNAGSCFDDFSCNIPTITGQRPILNNKLNINQLNRPTSLKQIKISQHCMPNILNTNIRGGITGKIDEISTVFVNNAVMVGCITESWLRPSIQDSAFLINNYTCYRRDRSDGRQGGGVVVYVRQDLSCKLLDSYGDNHIESLWLLCRFPRMPRSVSYILIGAVYHPPDGDNKLMTSHIIDCLDRCSQSHPNLGIILLGDFNQLPHAVISNYPLRQVVKSATRGNAILDKIFTNMSEWYLTPVIIPAMGNSDHAVVLMMANANPTYKPGSDVLVCRRCWDSNSKVLLANALKTTNWSSLYSMESVQDMTDYFYNTVKTLFDAYAPVCYVKRHSTDKPWVTDKFRLQIRQRQFAFRTGDMVKFKKLRNAVQRLAKKLRSQYYNKQMKSLRNSDPHRWWKNTKQFVGLAGNSSHGELKQLANSLYDGDMERMTNDINNFFLSVASDIPPLQSDSSVFCNISQNNDYEDSFIIEPWQVERKLAAIKTHKAAGPDNIPNWFIKEMSPFIADPICAIFNASIRQGFVPDIWKTANVVPVPKVKPLNSIQNDLRPISLTPSLSKILESFVGRWILDKLGHNFDINQYGGLRARSTIHALVSILHHWSCALDSGKSVRALFVDFRKAFDRVDHNILLTKITSLGIPKFVICWLFSFLSSRKQRVKIDNLYSACVDLIGGMPQGTWLGPLIFIIYVNDLKLSSIVHKFIDDTTLTEILPKSPSPSQEDSNMDFVLNELIHWSSNNRMIINSIKTKEMILGNYRNNHLNNLCVDDVVIESVSVFKLLGVHIAHDLRWDVNTDAIFKKASSRLYFLRLLKRAGLSPNDLRYFYITVVRPVLEYGCVVWNHNLPVSQSDKLESIQKRALRIINGNISTEMPYSSLLFLSQLEPLNDRRSKLCKRFFEKMCCDDNCLHELLPPKRNSSLLDRLRHPSTYPVPSCRTKRYQSFINFALLHYQHE